MAWHRHLTLDRKGHPVKIGTLLGLISGLILYSQLSDWCRDNWCDINDGRIIIVVALLFVIGWGIAIKGAKMFVKKRGG